jgi:hypothetical protein
VLTDPRADPTAGTARALGVRSDGGTGFPVVF